MKEIKRAQLDSELEHLKPLLEKTFDRLKQEAPDYCYPSMVLERRQKRHFTVNSRAESMTEDFVSGVILRIFDGETLFEEATQDFSSSSFYELVNRLIFLVRQKDIISMTGSSSSFLPEKKKTKITAYHPPTWSERLSLPLDQELLCQIPPHVKAETWVHFGVSQITPLWENDEDIMALTKNYFQRLKDAENELSSDHVARSPDFLLTRLSLEKVDFIFIDAETRMSQTLLRNNLALAALKNGERGHVMQGGLGGQETTTVKSSEFQQVYEKLGKSLRAGKIQPGRYKVLMHPSITGVFAHEAFGHSQEGDTWARGRSKARELYESKEKVGNQHATIMNNPAIFKNGSDSFAAWGSYFFDEEGWLAQEHCLVKEGVLQAPMTHLTSSVRLGVPRTANGKRENWTHGMYVRQTNTYFSPGHKTFEQLMAMIDEGFLASEPYGGMEDPKGMGIQVGMGYVEEIKNGQLTGRVFKGPNGGAIQMTGYVPQYLESIIDKSKIDFHDEEMDESTHPWNEVGGCGKYHKEYVVAGCGGPYMLVDQVLLS